MKVVLLFDSDKVDNRYREYELGVNDKDLRMGKGVEIKFCHPDCGEIMMSKIYDDVNFKEC